MLGKGRSLIPDDHVISANLLDQGHLIGTAHLGDDPGSGQMRQLDGKIAHTTGCPGNAHAPMQQETTLGEGIQGRQASYRQRRGLGEGDVIRQLGQGMGRDNDRFGPSARAQEADYPRTGARA